MKPTLTTCSAIGALVASALFVPRPVAACSQSMPVRHSLGWTAQGAFALIDPEGQAMRVGGGTAEVLALAHEYPFDLAAFTPDGRSMVVLQEDFADADRGAGCMATYVHVYRVDLETGARTRMRRLRSADASGVRINGSGTHALVIASNFSQEPHVHLFDLSDGRRLRVIPGIDAAFVGDGHFVLHPETGRVKLYPLAGRPTATLPAPREDHALGLLPGGSDDESFWLVERGQRDRRLIRVRIDGRRVRFERARWTFRGRTLSMSRGGTRLASLGGSGALIRVHDAATGAVVARVSGQRQYTNGALSDDGATIAVAPVRPVSEAVMRNASADPASCRTKPRVLRAAPRVKYP